MALTISTNVMSLSAQRQLERSRASLASPMRNLSTGLRINSAKDDAAGFAIATRFTSQINGYNQAIRNASDGISLTQTAEGGLKEVSNSLQRIRELAVQASNGSLTDKERTSLQGEADALSQEISRIVKNTRFNGMALFSGGETLAFQVGDTANDGNSIEIETVDLAGASGASPAATAAAQAMADAADTGTTVDDSRLAMLDYWKATYSTAITPYLSMGSATGITGWGMWDGFPGFNDLDYAAWSGRTEASDAAYAVMKAAYDDIVGGDTTDSNASMVAAATAAVSGAGSSGGLNSYSASLTAEGTIDISTAAAASSALSQLDDDLDTVSSARATFGAGQNRLESTIRNLQSLAENIAASRSRVMDADIAAETASLTRAQIIQQSGAAMLSQANAMPNGILALIA